MPKTNSRKSMLLMVVLLTTMPAMFLTTEAAAADKKPKLLLIGIDGCRPDALAKAKTPSIDELAAGGVLLPAENLPERNTGGETTSHPMWFSVLTGVWPDKHGIRRGWYKKERHNPAYPHFFARLKAHDPQIATASVSSWRGIERHMTTNADINECLEADAPTAHRAVDVLSQEKTDVLFVHFGDPDTVGHKDGFSPDVPAYLAAIEGVDEQVGRLVQAVRRRPNYKDENWLVMVTTDHGGKETTHTSTGEIPEMRRVFILVSGESAQQGTPAALAYTVDVAPTALTHFGVTFDPAWKLDGKPVGLKATPSP